MERRIRSQCRVLSLDLNERVGGLELPGGAGFLNKTRHPPLLSGGFCRARRPLDGFQVGVQKRVLLVTLLLVLLAQPDHFSKDLHVEAVTLGFQVNFLFGLGKFLDLVFDMLNPFDDSSQLIARNPHRLAHGLLLVNMPPRKSAIQGGASSRANERGNQPVNPGQITLLPQRPQTVEGERLGQLDDISTQEANRSRQGRARTATRSASTLGARRRAIRSPARDCRTRLQS
jgi:hypothetical protein